MLYFILEIIVFIAHFFKEPQAKPIGQHEGGLEKRIGGVRANHQGNAKVCEIVPIPSAAVADLPRLCLSLQHRSQLGIRQEQPKFGL